MGPSAVRVLSLCSGICGLDLGVKLALPLARTICYVERDPYCQRVILARIADGHLDDAPVWDDLATFDPGPWNGNVDLVVAGPPCQPFSSAARGRNNALDLSGHVVRTVLGCRPEAFLLENVRHSEDRMLEVREQLIAEGYHCPPALEVSASDVGAPHGRPRLFLAGHSDGYRQPGLRQHAEVARLSESGGGLWGRVPEGLGVPDGSAGRVDRLRAAGNAVVPLVAAFACRALGIDSVFSV